MRSICLSLYLQIILATSTTGIPVCFVFSCGVPLSELNASDEITLLVLWYPIEILSGCSSLEEMLSILFHGHLPGHGR